MKILVTADSTADLNAELLAEYGIELAPLTVQIGAQSYHDGVDVTQQDIFTASESGKKVATSAVNTFEYIELFERKLKECDELIHVCIGSHFSACYQNACAAAEKLGHVHVLDSRNLSTGNGMLAVHAAQLAQAGELTAAEILEKLKDERDFIDMSFVIDAIDYLYRGGRCSGIAAVGAKLISIKPSVELYEGKMVVGRKYRGSIEHSAIRYTKNRLEDLSRIDPECVYIVHSCCPPEMVEAVRKIVEETGYFKRIHVTVAGSTICTHCGPSTIGLAVLLKQPKELNK